MSEQYQVEIQICVGNEKPFPIEGFPALPTYIFGTVGPAEDKELANRRMLRLAELNPGYSFTIRQAR